MAEIPPGYVPYVSSADTVGSAVTTGDFTARHPEYDCKMPDWRQMRHTYSGQRCVKEQGFCYLPPTSGMREDGLTGNAAGWCAYQAYICRALYHNFVKEGVATALGMLWNKPATYEIPEEMEYLRDKASVTGEGLAQLHRAINQEQIITGRCGLLADIDGTPVQGQVKPYLALYTAEAILNWDSGFRGDSPVEAINLVVLDESGARRFNTFQWRLINQYRVLMLGDIDKNEPEGIYRFGVFTSDGSGSPVFDKSKMNEATKNGKALDQIPFCFINCDSTESYPSDPPILGLSDLCLAIYRLEADYRQSLFMQTQDTLFTSGFNEEKDKPLRTGAGGRIHSPVKDGNAKFIGVSSVGLPELRTALENDIKRAAMRAGDTTDPSSRARESGSALELRIGSKTATLNEIAISGAEGLQRALRSIAKWMGLSEDKISKILVKPNFEFASSQFNALSYKAIVESKLLGAPIDWESIQQWAGSQGGPGANVAFADIMKRIEDEVVFNDVLGPQITPLQQEQLDQGDAALEIQQTVADKPVAAPTNNSGGA